MGLLSLCVSLLPSGTLIGERVPAVISIPAWRIGGFWGLGWDIHLNVHYTPSHGVASTSPSSNKLCLAGWACW